MTLSISKQYRAAWYSPQNRQKIAFLILHYTALPLHSSLALLVNQPDLAEPDIQAGYFQQGFSIETQCQTKVSTHYLLTESGVIHQLVEDHDIAYHAGVSYWDGYQNLNRYSIGIEQVNQGYVWLSRFPADRIKRVPGSPHRWCAFEEAQIQALIPLCQHLIQRYQIPPYHVLGHSDIALGRKQDPGPLFPWQRLAEAGIGLWYDPAMLHTVSIPRSEWIIRMSQQLRTYGYRCPVQREDSVEFRQVMQAFQMHFRPNQISGEVDPECLSIIDNLCQQKAAWTRHHPSE